MQFERAGRATHRARRLFLARVVGGSCAFGLAAAARAALAQGFPNRPIRLIVPYPPGGPLDIAARALAEQLKGSLGTVVVENRPGAGGNIGVDALAKSAPDGYTLGIGAVATHAINPWLFTRIPYDPLKDFAPITLIAHVPNVLVMTSNPSSSLRPASPTVGTSGMVAARARVVTANARSLPALICAVADARLSNMKSVCPDSSDSCAGAAPG